MEELEKQIENLWENTAIYERKEILEKLLKLTSKYQEQIDTYYWNQ